MTQKSYVGKDPLKKPRFVKGIERIIHVNGRTIRAQRDFLGMSRRGVANLCGWSIGHQQNIEEKDIRMRLSQYIKLMNALRVEWEPTLEGAKDIIAEVEVDRLA